jgi:hypothetical protein
MYAGLHVFAQVMDFLPLHVFAVASSASKASTGSSVSLLDSPRQSPKICG